MALPVYIYEQTLEAEEQLLSVEVLVNKDIKMFGKFFKINFKLNSDLIKDVNSLINPVSTDHY